MKKKRDEDGKIPRITKTCKVVLDGSGRRLPVGDFTLTEKEPGPKLEDFADAAFKASRASLVRLMTPLYRLVVIDGQREEAYGLGRWIKLVDGSKEQEESKARKQTIRKKATA